MRKKTLVAFDLDGTLIDSMPLLERASVDLLTRRYTMDRRLATRAYRRTAGVAFRQQLEEILPGDTRHDVTAEIYEQEKMTVYAHAPLFLDVRDALRTARNNEDVVVRLASSTTSQLARYALARYQLVLRPLEGVDKFARLHAASVTYDRVVFIGDLARDARIARAAGVEFVGVCRPYAPRARFAASLWNALIEAGVA